jgi:hypothetical protein
MTCECERSGDECGVRVYVGEPGKGYWTCQREDARKQALITQYYRERSGVGQPPPQPR